MSKVSHWNYIRGQIKKDFLRMGVTRCEICNAAFPLSFAHRYKRRFITDDQELRMVALLCNADHERIEHSGHDAMYAAITKIIEARNEHNI